MVKANPLQTSINAGEFSPRMAARVDFSKYPSAAACCKNMLPQPQGGSSRRAGTRYVAEVKDSSAKSRLLRFEFSTTQAYVIEAGNTYFRFYKNQAQITVADTEAAITNGTFDSDVSSWTDQSGAGSSISHNGTLNAMNLTSNGTTDAHAEQQVTNTTADEMVVKFRVFGAPGDQAWLRIGTTSTGTEIKNDIAFKVGFHTKRFTPGAVNFFLQFLNKASQGSMTVQVDNISLIDNAATEIETPWPTADLFALKTAQSANEMYIAHPDYPVYRLERHDHVSWSLEQVAWQDGPYIDKNTTSTTFTPAATSGHGIIVTASATTGINDGDGFKLTDVGRLLRIDSGSAEPGWGIIVEFTDTTHVKIDIKRNVVATAQTGWSLGSWSDTTGHPAAVAFFEQRLVAARTATKPQGFWLSQSADLENHRPDSYDSGVTVDNDDALDFTLAADQANVIQWLSPGIKLVLGTSGGLWVAESDGPTLTPTDIQVRRQVTNGCADVAPARVDDVAIYLQRGKRKIREFAFTFESDGYRAPDLTILADHITKSTVVEFAYQEEPDSVLWCVRSDGILATMTYKRDQDVVGWSRQELGGTFNTVPPVAESVTTIPGTNGSGQIFDSTERDEVWIIVKRTINTATKRFIEFVEKDFDGPVRQDHTSDANWDAAMIDEQQNSFCIDCGLTLDSPITITVITAANPPVVTTATNHGFSNGDQVRVRAVKGMTEVNGNAYLVSDKTNTTLELQDLDGNDVDGTGFAAYVADGEVRKEVTLITGLGHLEGETLKILANGAVHPDKTVSSGAITLDYRASRVHAGLGFAHHFESLKLNAGAAAGTAVAKTKRVHKVGLILKDSATTKIGPKDIELETVEFREVADAMDTAVPLFTGEKVVEFDGDYDTDPRLVIKHDAPAPFTILALATELKTNESL